MRESSTRPSKMASREPDIRDQRSHPIRVGAIDDAVKTYEEAAGRGPAAIPPRAQPGDLFRETLGRWQGSVGRAFRRRSRWTPQRGEANLGWGISLLRQEARWPAIACFDTKVLAANRTYERRPVRKSGGAAAAGWKFDEATGLCVEILGKDRNRKECLVNPDHHRHSAQRTRRAIQVYIPNVCCHASAFAGRAGRSGHLRVSLQRLRSRVALLREAGGVHAGSFRTVVQSRRSPAEVRPE